MFYKNSLDTKKTSTDITTAGRAAHVIRNYLQGFTTLQNPVFLTIDTISGQIEAKIREIKSLINQNFEIKSKIAEILLSTIFLKKICNENFITNSNSEKKICDENLKKIKNSLLIIETIMINVDKSINNAILKQSENFYGKSEKLKYSKIPFTNIDKNILKKLDFEFCTTNYLSSENLKKKEKKFFFSEKIKKLSEYITNKSHLIQDEISEYQNKNKIVTDQVKTIINFAGQIENKYRESLKMLVLNDNFRLPYRNKVLGDAKNILKGIKKIFLAKNFKILKKKENLENLVLSIENLLGCLKEVYDIGFIQDEN